MSDQGFREVQLSGKQVVFLFMAGAVALVGTFLLGVSAGKGVTAAPDSTAQATPTPAVTDPDPNPTAPLPPATTPAPGSLDYHKTLQATPTPTPVDSPLPTAKPAAPEPTAKPTPAAKSPEPSKSAGAVWYVQVASFSSRSNANDQVAQLKAKGITASTITVSGSKAPYKVRIGPLERAAADAMVTRLRKEGLKPSSPSR